MTSQSEPPPGYHGAYVRIDLATGSSLSAPLSTSVLRASLGGAGLGTYLLLEEDGPETDALSPEAPLAFVFSPLVGSPLTTSAKFAVVSKSPLTDRLNDSLASSTFALAGKRAGCDAIVIVGRAEQPSVLVIDDGQARLEPAGDFWGTECREAQERLGEQLGGEYQLAVIGPAGERQVRYATISHDGRHAGRGGSGAVMGSKNLKAIAVRGSQRAAWADPEGLARYAKTLSDKSFGPATAKYRELGTAANLLVMNRLAALPTRNFQQGSFDGAANLAPESLTQSREKARASCAACTIGCEHIYTFGGSASTNTQGQDANDARGSAAQNKVRVEYENLFALGPLCGVDDTDVVLRASKRCDELGIDTISAGGTIAFAMECVERGLLDAPWLRFGDGAALLKAVESIGNREGLGDALAEGSRRMAWRLGGDAIRFAPQVKGLEIPGYEPRAMQTMALGFAVGTRGADHNRSGAYEVDFSDQVDRRSADERAARLAVETEDRAAIMDSMILCKFIRGALDDFFADAAEMLALVTGLDFTADELRKTARSIVSAKKRFNIRAGWTPEEDTLPARFLEESLPEDARATLTAERLAQLVAAYNLHRGWTAEGWLPDGETAQNSAPVI